MLWAEAGAPRLLLLQNQDFSTALRATFDTRSHGSFPSSHP